MRDKATDLVNDFTENPGTAVILVLALAIGLVFIFNGIWIVQPHLIVPDGRGSVNRALEMGVQKTPFIPQFEKGGNLHEHVLAASFVPNYLWLKATGEASNLRKEAAKIMNSDRIVWSGSERFLASYYGFIFSAKLVSAIAGFLTLATVYLLGKELFDSKSGALAALTLAVTMSFINMSRYITEDIIVTFFSTLTFLFLAKFYNTGDRRMLYIGTFVSGMAVASKAIAGLLAIPIAAVLVREHWGDFEAFVKEGFRFVTPALLAYLIFTPSVFVYPGIYWQDVVQHYILGENISGYSPYPTWITLILFLIRGFGLPLFLLTASGFVYAVYSYYRRKNFSIVLLLTFIIPYYLFNASYHTVELPRTLPLVPLLSVFTGYFSVKLIENGKGKNIAIPIVSAIFLFSFIYTGSTVLQMANDSRIEATDWMRNNIEPGSEIDVYSPRVYLPEFPEGTEVGLYNNKKVEEAESFSQGVKRLESKEPDYIVLSSNNYGGYFSSNPAVKEEGEFFGSLMNGSKGYEVVKVFGSQDSTEYGILHMLDRSLFFPKPYRPANPTIVILERK